MHGPWISFFLILQLNHGCHIFIYIQRSTKAIQREVAGTTSPYLQWEPTHVAHMEEENPSCCGNCRHAGNFNWYEGDELTTETAEDVRSKLDKLTLSTRITGSEYINNFQLYTKQLEDLGESYTTSKTVSIFLDQISDPDYTSTKELCIENQHTLDECIARIRAKERRLDRERLRHRRRSISVRRGHISQDEQEDDPDDYDLSEFLTEKGYYSIPPRTWKSLSKEDREKIKQFNGLLRKKRRNSGDIDQINNRRAPHQDQDNKKRKTIQFQDQETQDHPKDDETPSTVSEEDVAEINNRRHTLTFSTQEE